MLFARANSGTFVLRIEDTDQARSTDAAMQAQMQDLQWLGLQWDEGPIRQSERLEIYQTIADNLLEQGLAYYCFLTDAEIEQYREQKQAWNSPYRELSLTAAKAKIAAGAKPTIRFRVPEKKMYKFNDMVRGEIALTSEMVGDFVIIRSDGMPVYNFCCAIDDAKMAITHVFRGEEHLSNTLRQLMIYEAMAVMPPHFGHLSIILGSDKKKLSKRQGAVSCDSFRASGYLPAALINYIALLGWSPKTEQELFSLTELAKIFQPEHLNAAAPIFDQKKLDWLNSQHMRAIAPLVLFELVMPFLKTKAFSTEPKIQAGLIELLVSDANTLVDLADAMAVYFTDYNWQAPAEFAEVAAWPSTVEIWRMWHSWLSAIGTIDTDSVRLIMQEMQANLGVKGKQLFMPLRIAVLGQCQGADVKLAAPLIATSALIARVEACLEAL